MAKELEGAIKSKEIFFASVSHELRNPLNSLLGCIDLLATGSSADKYDKELMQTATNCAEILLNLIGNVLDITKLQTDKLDLEILPCNIRELLTKIHNVSTGQSSTKGIGLDLVIENNVPMYIEIDSSRVSQVLINLVSNAIKFTDNGGVTIVVSWVPDTIKNDMCPNMTENEENKFLKKPLADDMFIPHSICEEMHKSKVLERETLPIEPFSAGLCGLKTERNGCFNDELKDSDTIMYKKRVLNNDMEIKHIEKKLKNVVQQRRINEKIFTQTVDRVSSADDVPNENIIHLKDDMSSYLFDSKATQRLSFESTMIGSPNITSQSTRPLFKYLNDKSHVISNGSDLLPIFTNEDENENSLSSNMNSVSIDEESKTDEEIIIPKNNEYDPKLNDFYKKMRVGYLKIEIIDTGVGISETNLDKLFKPFAQADNTINRKFGGSGLGLWISKRIVNLMQGDLKVHSSLGKGSDFMVVMPARINNNLSANVSPQKTDRTMKALIVEDQKYNQRIIKGILERMGVDVYAMDNGIQGYKCFHRNPLGYFDFIITNLNMPILDGTKMIKKIRDYENYKRATSLIPIIVITADQNAKEKQQGCLEKLKVTNFLVKPLSMTKLQMLVSHIRKNKCLPQQYSLISGSMEKKQAEKEVLIIDDDLFSSGIVKTFLNISGYHCQQVFSGEDGLKIIKEKHCSIGAIILDTQMSGISGYETSRQIRQFEKEKGFSNIFIMSLSGNSDDNHKMQVSECGMNDTMVKPIDKVKLLMIINKVYEDLK